MASCGGVRWVRRWSSIVAPFALLVALATLAPLADAAAGATGPAGTCPAGAGAGECAPGSGAGLDAHGELFGLHAIDMTRTDEARMRDELMAQMSTVGFLVLTNIPDYDEAAYLRACKALHALSPAQKRRLYLRHDEAGNANIYRGYQPFKANDASHKEFFDQGFALSMLSESERAFPLYEATPFPLEPELAWIRGAFDKVFLSWYGLALRVVRLLAEGLGKPRNYFDAWFVGGSLSTFRTIHYLPRRAGVVDSSDMSAEDRSLTTPPHADSGFLTFLATFGYPGLQVLVDGKYRSVAPMNNTLVVNLGDTFARITHYRLKATFHRVLDINEERYSSPMFLEPKYSARIPKGLLESDRSRADERVGEEDVMFGDWLIRRMMHSYVEWKTFQVPESRKRFVDAVKLSDFVN